MDTPNTLPDDTGSSCPLEYRYRARDFNGCRTDTVHTAYVIGGLYGNIDALQAIRQMRDAEQQTSGRSVEFVFNGDYHWFDTDADSFIEVSEAALAGLSIRGNVEAELASTSDEGCGCNYPDYVNAEYVERSNAIMALLRKRAKQHPELCTALQQLPFFRVLEVGQTRIGIVHGDAESLSGWDFAADRLSPIDKCCSGDQPTTGLTPVERIERYFRESGLHAFACTHTCLAHARDFTVDGVQRLIINNGAAGLSNFTSTGYGLITRISADPTPPAGSLYGITINGTRFDALAVHFDKDRWLERFLRNWPPGSPAHEAYYKRIVEGPDFDLSDAMGGSLRKVA